MEKSVEFDQAWRQTFDRIIYTQRWENVRPFESLAFRLNSYAYPIGDYFHVDTTTANISYSPLGKEQGFDSKGRVEKKPGRFVKALFPTLTDPQVEMFVTEWKVQVDKLADVLAFELELLSGEDIREAYHEGNYGGGDTGDLTSSCMRYRHCQDYFDIYVMNEKVVKLLVARDSEGFIMGRTLVWTLTDGRVAYDRIYAGAITRRHMEDYAKERGWVNVWGYEGRVNAEVDLDHAEFSSYPYLDSMCSLNLNGNGTGTLRNWGNSYDLSLTSTEGGPHEALHRCERCEDRVMEEDSYEILTATGWETWCYSCGECECGTTYEDDHRHDLASGRAVCTECYEAERCSECAEEVGAVHLIAGYCEACYDNKFCEECSSEVNKWGDTYCDTCKHNPEIWEQDEALCNDCGRAVDRLGDEQCFTCETMARPAIAA